MFEEFADYYSSQGFIIPDKCKKKAADFVDTHGKAEVKTFNINKKMRQESVCVYVFFLLVFCWFSSFVLGWLVACVVECARFCARNHSKLHRCGQGHGFGKRLRLQWSAHHYREGRRHHSLPFRLSSAQGILEYVVGYCHEESQHQERHGCGWFCFLSSPLPRFSPLLSLVCVCVCVYLSG